MTRTLATYALLWTLVATAVATGIVVGLLVAHAILPDAVAASRAAPESIPAVSRPVAGSVTLDDLAQRGQPEPAVIPAPTGQDSEPSPGRITPSPSPIGKRPASTRAPETAASLSGIASFMAPSYGAAYLALPDGPGQRVTICGPAACVTRTSNDAGPDKAMQRAGRVADLSFADFRTVCGCDPWVVGLVRVSVTP